MNSTVCVKYLKHIGNSLKQLYKLGETVIGKFTLPTEMMVIGWDELAEGHTEVRLVTE